MAPDSEVIDKTHWPAIAIILTAGVVGAFQVGKLPAALHEMRAELDLDLIAAGWVISTIAGVGVATGMIWGYVGDRLGHRRVVLGGLALLAAGSIAGAAADSVVSILITRLVEGVGYIAIITSAPLLIPPLVASGDRHIALGIWSFYMPFGMSGMVLLSPLLLPIASWRGLWLFNGALAIAVLATLALTIRRTPARTPDAVSSGGASLWSSMAQTVTRPGPVALAIAFGAYSLIYLSVTSFLPTFLIERRGVDPETAALMVALVIFMNAPGCFVGGWLMKRRATPWLVIAAGYVGMVLCGLGVYAETLDGGTRYVLALLLPFFGGFIPPTVLARIPFHAASPMLGATTMGLIVQAISFGQLIGPPILAALVSRAGVWQDATQLTIGAAAVGLAAALVLRHTERQQEAIAIR